MSLIKLIEQWRKPGYGSEIKTICANQLERAMPAWTTITDNPDSWPEFDFEYGVVEFEVVARFPKKDGSLGVIEAFKWDEEVCESIKTGDRLSYIGGIYRLADDYDSPPTEKTNDN